jgi:hypothetical protein
MFEHLVQFNPEPTPPGIMTRLADAEPGEVLAAQVTTASWLQELGVPPDDEVIDELEKADARKAFQALTTNTDTTEQKAALVQLKTPEAVRHITGMLTAYDWEFIEQAKELRGYTVAKLVEETTNANPNIRLKALGLLGKVTEVGLFTDKIEVKKTDMTEDEIDKRLKEKLAKFMDVSDADVTDITEIPTTPPTPDDNSHNDALASASAVQKPWQADSGREAGGVGAAGQGAGPQAEELVPVGHDRVRQSGVSGLQNRPPPQKTGQNLLGSDRRNQKTGDHQHRAAYGQVRIQLLPVSGLLFG